MKMDSTSSYKSGLCNAVIQTGSAYASPGWGYHLVLMIGFLWRRGGRSGSRRRRGGGEGGEGFELT